MKLTDEMRKWRAEGRSFEQIAKRVNRCKTTVQKAFCRDKHPVNAVIPSGAKVRTLGDFQREHDQAWKIRDGLKRLFAGGVYMTDAEFRDAVSANPSRWRHAADSSEFSEYRYRVHGEVLWASKETIREMRKIRGEAI